MTLWWLSFADPDRPKGQQFLGVVIVPGDDMIMAVKMAHLLKINPGGQVLGHPIDPRAEALVGDKWRGRLLDRSECEALGAAALAVLGDDPQSSPQSR